MRNSIAMGLGVTALCLAIHCVAGKPPLESATDTLRFACEALAVRMTEGSAVPVDQVIAKACHAEQIVEQMRTIVKESALPGLLKQELDDWPSSPPASHPDGGV